MDYYPQPITQNDPADSNLRISPTYPPIAELEQAVKVLCLCVKMAAIEELTK